MGRSFVGVDLGQSQDFTAVAVVERGEWRGEWDAVAWAHRKESGLRLRHLERVELGTPYPEVVGRVAEVTRDLAAAAPCQLVVDGTGVGRPVVDMLRRAETGCRMLPVLVTGGERERWEAGYWRVPKRDLMVGLQVLFQKGELRIARGLPMGGALMAEMTAMQVKQTPYGREQFGAWREGTHDDLVFAVALACWGAKKMYPGGGADWWRWNRESELGKMLLGM